MTISFKKVLLGMVALLLLVVQTTMEADIHEQFKTDNDSPEVLLRKATGAFDLQKNTVSNIEFYTTNYGIFGYNVANRTGGSHWPRNSLNQYIFAGGVWLGAKVERTDPNTGETIIDPETGRPELTKLCELTYNPRDGSSWMVPGRIKDQTGFSTPMVDNDAAAIQKYRTYFSTDFLGNGEPLDDSDGPSWPIWDSSDDDKDTLKTKRYFGYYIEDTDRRTDALYAKGPAFISGEDIFATYKDTDLRYYEGGFSQAQQKGYPFEIQYEQMIYSWGFGDYKDFIFIKYDLISFNEDTLRDCWLAPVMDVDIAREPNTSAGAVNDRVRYYNEDSTLNMAVQWSQADRGEGGRGFGYLGYDFLESPAVQGDTLEDGSPNPLQGFLRTDKRKYSNAEQLGLQTFNNWNIADDLTEDKERYDFLSTLARDGDEGSGDKRFMMATGPFNMKPYDTARVVVGIIIAESVKDLLAPDGTTEDMAALVTKDKFAQTVYDNNFKAPMPPRRARLSAEGVNNGIIVSWDDYSELSEDNEENGLDFMGYRLFRARRDDIANYTNHQTDTSGPLGWRQIAEWSIPTAFEKSVHKAGDPDEAHIMPYIDSLMIIGPVVEDFDSELDEADEFNIRVMRVCRGCIMESPDFFNLSVRTANEMMRFDTLSLPMIVDIDTSEITTGPWGKYFYSVANKSRLGVNLNKYRFEAAKPNPQDQEDLDAISANRAEYLERGYRYDPTKEDFLLDSILVGTVELKSALLDYNPLFYMRKTTQISLDEYLNFQNYVNFPTQFPKQDTLRWQYGTTTDSLGNEVEVKVKVDTIFYFSTAVKRREAGREVYVMEYAPFTDSVRAIMSDASHLQYVNDMLYTFIQQGKAKVNFPMFEEVTTYQAVKLDEEGNPYTELDTIVDEVDFPQTKRIREGILPEYMAKITNNRTYIDLGDNGDGKFDYVEDPTQTEQMINNVDYYYKLISFDEGDYQQPTEIKANDASLALPNEVEVRPRAAGITEDLTFNVEVATPDKIGGLYNFEFFALDQQRVSQFFAGHVLELEFKPYWTLASVTFTGESNPSYFGKYGRFITLTDSTTGQLLYEGLTEFESAPGEFTYAEAFTENGLSYVMARKDSVIADPISGEDIDFSQHDSRQVRERFGVWTTGEMEEPLYTPYIGTSKYTFADKGAYIQASGFQKPAYGALSFKFDYHIKQYGGDFRMDTVLVRNSNNEEKQVDLIIPRFTDYGRKTLNIEANKSIAVDEFSETFANTVTTQMVGMDYQQKVASRALYGSPAAGYLNATMVSDYGNPIIASYNNGPGTYELTFTGKETRTIDVWFYDKDTKQDVEVTFDVDVLTVDVKNTTTYERRDGKGNTAVVSYESPMQHMHINPAPFDQDGYSFYGPKSTVGDSPGWLPVYDQQALYTKSYPYPVNTIIDGIHPDDTYNTYNIFAAGWINCREESREMTVKVLGERMARQMVNGQKTNADGYEILYSGIQGAYALPATSRDGKYTIDFVNVIYISGVPFFFDGANAGSNTPSKAWDQMEQDEFKFAGANFEQGDKLILSTTGGALGLPAPGAKVRIEVGGSPIEANRMEDEDLDAIRVVPNPYFISHQGQKSAYGAELYFTRLPEECTIDIYTVTGELVKRIEHNEFNSADPDKVSVDIWNLLSDNNQRVASQALVAVITTPNGATTVKNFSVVVGSYRIITD